MASPRVGQKRVVKRIVKRKRVSPPVVVSYGKHYEPQEEQQGEEGDGQVVGASPVVVGFSKVQGLVVIGNDLVVVALLIVGASPAYVGYGS